MGKHYCRKGGAPVGAMDVPPFADPGRVVQNNDRLVWEAPSYGRVRLLWRCCGTALVEFMTEPDSDTCPDTYTLALALSALGRIPDGVSYSVPCIGAEWSADLPCGHINGEGCDCDTVAVESGDDVPYMSTYRNQIDRPALCSLDTV
jgi:hypothetical protein